MKRVILFLLRGYKYVSCALPMSAALGVNYSGCRSWPTCSDYAVQAVERHGALQGTFMAVKRFLRCR